MLQNPNFPGLRPEPPLGSLQRSPDLLAHGEGLAVSRCRHVKVVSVLFDPRVKIDETCYCGLPLPKQVLPGVG